MRKMKDSGIEWIGMIPEGSPAFLEGRRLQSLSRTLSRTLSCRRGASDFLAWTGSKGSFPETGLVLFHPIDATPRHQYRRGYDASPTRMARHSTWDSSTLGRRQSLAAFGQPVVAGLVLCPFLISDYDYDYD